MSIKHLKMSYNLPEKIYKIWNINLYLVCSDKWKIKNKKPIRGGIKENNKMSTET